MEIGPDDEGSAARRRRVLPALPRPSLHARPSVWTGGAYVAPAAPPTDDGRPKASLLPLTLALTRARPRRRVWVADTGRITAEPNELCISKFTRVQRRPLDQTNFEAIH